MLEKQGFAPQSWSAKNGALLPFVNSIDHQLKLHIFCSTVFVNFLPFDPTFSRCSHGLPLWNEANSLTFTRLSFLLMKNTLGRMIFASFLEDLTWLLATSAYWRLKSRGQQENESRKRRRERGKRQRFSLVSYYYGGSLNRNTTITNTSSRPPIMYKRLSLGFGFEISFASWGSKWQNLLEMWEQNLLFTNYQLFQLLGT